MADNNHAPATGTTVGELPAAVLNLLEKHVPRSDSAEFARGVLSGLGFALHLLHSAPLTAGQARDAVADATARAEARLVSLEEEEVRAYYARAKEEFTAEQLAEFANINQEDLIPFEEAVREIEKLAEPQDPDEGTE